jgi:hypothetical protein
MSAGKFRSQSSPYKALGRGLAAVGVAAVLCTHSASAAPSTPSASRPDPAAGLRNRPARARDSFLYPPANSTAELVRAIEKDRALRLRYARHFHTSEDQVVNFVRRALIVYRLPATRDVTTYGVTRTGRIYPVRERLPKGTLVWATHSGTPVFKWRCANPLTTRLPGFNLPGGPRVARTPSPAKPTAPPPSLVTTVPVPALPPGGTPEEAPLPAVPPAPVFAAAPLPLSGGGSAAVPVIVTGGRGGAGWVFPLLFGLPFLPRGGGNGEDTSPPVVVPPPPVAPPTEGIPPLPPPPTPPGGDTPTTPPFTPPPGGDTPPPGGGPPPPTPVPEVPEPGPVAVFALAALWGGGLAVRRRARRVP